VLQQNQTNKPVVNMLINDINLHQAWLITGDHRQRNNLSWYVTSHPGQLSQAIPPWVGAVSISRSSQVSFLPHGLAV